MRVRAATHTARRAAMRRKCLHIVNGRAMMTAMDAVTLPRRHVIVDARALDDLLEVARLVADRLPGDDNLRLALNGARAQVLSGATLEP